MKINWGTKIAVFYISFVLFIIVMVVMAFGEKYELVTEDYYQQEIEFQDKIDRSANANSLEDKLKIDLKDGHVVLNFPSSNGITKGKINFFRPSDETADFEELIQLEDNMHKVTLASFKKGKYLVKTSWENNNQKYFQEDIIIIP